MEGTVPLGTADLWQLLSLHMDEDTIRVIHPWMVRGNVVREEGRVTHGSLSLPKTHIVEREIRVAGRRFRDTWTYAIAPPMTFAYEIKSPEGLVSTVANTYAEEGAQTRVLTEASLDFGRVPGFLQRRLGTRLLERADAEDLAYLGRYGFWTTRETGGGPAAR